MTFGLNDYPYAGQCPAVCGQEKPIGQGVAATCECASFLLWRLSNDLHFTLGQGYNDAQTWAHAAQNQGLRVDGSPGLHSVLCPQPGQQGASAGGHVALVLEVGPSPHAGPGHVWVEQYNGNVHCNYSQQQWANAPGVFIHFNDSTPVSIWYENFTVTAYPGKNETLHVRSGPGTQFSVVGNIGNGVKINCDRWTRGERILDPYNNVWDNRWYGLPNSGYVASALVGGDAPGSTPA